MDVNLFNFSLPDEVIAQTPCEPRDHARLLMVGQGHEFGNQQIRDVPQLLLSGDVLVLNNSKVIPARLFGVRKTHESAAKIEVLLHRDLTANSSNAPRVWTAFCRPAKKLRLSDSIEFGQDFQANVQEKLETGEVMLRYDVTRDELTLKLNDYGHMPLPPYIHREDTAQDAARYQTVYAQHDGSVAAPTAGLHFTDDVLEQLRARGVQIETVTLHVGAGTFQPVKVSDTRDHVMHEEWAEVLPETARRINDARSRGGRVVAVGTTSLRILETAADEQGLLHPYRGNTDIFITPGYRFRIVDRLLTNFHLPRSTLFMLVCAFAGRERMQEAYRYAIDNGYRFYSYGDASLLDKLS
jgi:S-adenosylmethionine:tRNA ribosyltransferase-isomerase